MAMPVCDCDSCRIKRASHNHPWRLVRSARAEWGHHVYWGTHCAVCGRKVEFTNDSDLRLCDRCEELAE